MAEIKQQLHPFTIPNFVQPVMKPRSRSEGFHFSQGIKLEDLPKDTVRELIDEFVINVWAKWNRGQEN